MQITQIKVTLHDDRQLRGFAKIVLEDCLAITGIKIIDGKRGLFLAMPTRAHRNGIHSDVCFPIKSWFRQQLEAEVLEEYMRLREEEEERHYEEPVEQDLRRPAGFAR